MEANLRLCPAGVNTPRYCGRPLVRAGRKDKGGGMNRERADAHLRLLAEAELREETGGAVRRNLGRLALIAPALFAVGAVDLATADEIQADLNLARTLRESAPGARVHLVAPRDPGDTWPALRPASWHVVPVGQVIRLREGDLRGELCLLAYAQTGDSGRFTAAGWVAETPVTAGPGIQPKSRLPVPPVPRRFRFTATDDRGTTYHLGSAARPVGRHLWYGVLDLRPDPPPGIRWLDLSPAPGEPPTRISLDPAGPAGPAPDVTMTQTTASPGELLLDVVAARLLVGAARYPQDTPEALKPGVSTSETTGSRCARPAAWD